jgi:hypothetical protein
LINKVLGRICSKCGRDFSCQDWYKDGHDGYLCSRCYKKQYYIKNRQKMININKSYIDRTKNKYTCIECGSNETTGNWHTNKIGEYVCSKCYNIKWKKDNKNYIKQYNRDWKEQNEEYHKNWYKDHKTQKNLYNKQWRISQAEHIKEYTKQYRIKNKDNLNNKIKNRTQNDINFKLKCNLRNRLYQAIKNNTKAGSAVRDLGCSISDFKKYIESKFKPGMTWENWGNGKDKWNLDHIVPLSWFDLTNIDQFIVACRWDNYQPLWWMDNIKKGNKLK